MSREKFLAGNERGEEQNLFVQGSGMFLQAFLAERVIPQKRKDNPMGQKGRKELRRCRNSRTAGESLGKREGGWGGVWRWELCLEWGGDVWREGIRSIGMGKGGEDGPGEKLLLGNDKEKGNESWEMVGMSLRMGTSWIEALRVLLEWWGLAEKWAWGRNWNSE